MRIMIVSDLAPPFIGGAESYVINLGRKLTELGYEVHWLTSKIRGTPAQEVYEGIRIHRASIAFSMNQLFPGRYGFPFLSLAAGLRLAESMDILQFNTYLGGLLGWLIGKASHRPSLLWCHEFPGPLWRLMGRNPVERRLYPFVEKFIAGSPYDWYACPSDYAKRTLVYAGAEASRISFIPLGIDFSSFNPKARELGLGVREKLKLSGCKVVGFSGRLYVSGGGQSKNVKMLLEAMGPVAKEVKNARLLLGGIGYEGLRPEIKKRGLKDSVLYVGLMSHRALPGFLGACDVVVCPALTDGFCLLLAEASACGIPTVATNAGAHPERIVNGETGVLVRPEPGELAEGLIKMLTDEELALKISRKALESVKPLSWERTARSHIVLYESLVRERVR